MTTITRAHLSGVTVRIRRGTTAQDSPMALARNGDHFAVAYDADVAPLDATSMLTRVRLGMEGYTVTEIILDSYGEVPTPVDRSDARRRDPERPAAPDDWLHQRTTADTKVTSWYLAQKSRTYDGFGQTGINGTICTRFTIPEELQKALLRKD
ncbi:hypothetical protein AB0I77_27425 [Streptomyces sp. NPDC050619]|uniref:hypothetical protein n=1 Tax=Streptomyces sp. NPDC050619 TaxID=3157214 RepID=UPI0034252C37